MNWNEILMIAVSLAMDAFAVSVADGAAVKKFNWNQAVILGSYFGGFQFLMPILGYFLGNSIKSSVEFLDHWIAFGLLSLIGIQMLKEAFCQETEECNVVCLTPRIMVMQAVATSIDALATGVGLAVLDVDIYLSATIIGVIAFIFSIAGGTIGKRVGTLIQKKATFIGGIILILIGVRILLQHLGMIG